MFKKLKNWFRNLFKDEIDLCRYRILESTIFSNQGKIKRVYYVQILSNKDRWRYFSEIEKGGSNNFKSIFNNLSDAERIIENYISYLNSDRNSKIVFEMNGDKED